eukprot:TRINITY_DN9147_c0_g2_i1.p1 TRINITY_DN9147_c0_g2~~TRINITY_DN9147_c0_g2_i1.p1  ORF type:complete len:479 (+),score=111.86 TRINITY_DN9147_c0_g2_i1:294-1730(+)
MRAARKFGAHLKENNLLNNVHTVKIELFGSLACTGVGHATPQALLMGLEGETPEGIEPMDINPRFSSIKSNNKLNLMGIKPIDFKYEKDMVWHPTKILPMHSNGLRFMALNSSADLIRTDVYYSVGGGFVVHAPDEESSSEKNRTPQSNAFVRIPDADKGGQGQKLLETVPTNEEQKVVLPPLQPIHAFKNSSDLLNLCKKYNKSISDIVMENECVWRSEQEVKESTLNLWKVMDLCITRGCSSTETHLPGKIKTRRRAPALFNQLNSNSPTNLERDPSLRHLDWLSCFALAVNEENAAGGRVVTAPTNGAAGIIPAVLKYYTNFVANSSDEGIICFLLTASAIGQLIKRGASISAAEVGCQGEVGVACSMAAAGLTAAMGGNVAQVEQAAEIGLEHNLGLTCDPIAGLVQIPCIERNAMGSAKAIAAARLALSEDGTHIVSLDSAIRTMRATGADMMSKYKETSEGGLAFHVNVPEC